MAETIKINQLIREKLDKDVHNHHVRRFIEDILDIERDHTAVRGKMKEYEKALTRRLMETRSDE